MKDKQQKNTKGTKEQQGRLVQYNKDKYILNSSLTI